VDLLSLDVKYTGLRLENWSGSLLFCKVRKSDTASSVDSLQAAVAGNIAQLEAQGLLTGAVLGQMFSSISDMLNADATDDQKGARLKVELLYVNRLAIQVDCSLLITDQSGSFFPDWFWESILPFNRRCVHGLLAFTILFFILLLFCALSLTLSLCNSQILRQQL
jgi:hypothetical protein